MIFLNAKKKKLKESLISMKINVDPKKLDVLMINIAQMIFYSKSSEAI